MQWRPPGAAKTRACARSGGRGGEAEVARGRGRDGGRQRRRRSQGLWAATSTAAVLGDVELARWGEQGNGRRRHQKKQVFGGRAKEGGRKYMGGPFVPGGGFTRDKRGFWAGRENSQPAAHL